MRSKLTWLLAVSLVFIISCGNGTKEEYLTNYKAFMNDLSINAETLKTDKDWKNYDKKYNTFRVKLQNKFSQELTWQEKLILAKYDVEYNTIRYKNMAKVQLGHAADMVSEAPKKIKDYVEKDMKQDLNDAKKQLDNATDTIIEAPEKIKTYVEEEMKQDVDIIIKNSKELKEKAEEAVDKTIEELKARHN